MICLSEKKQEEIIHLFLEHFYLLNMEEEVEVGHPTFTDNGCVHIDIGILENENLNYYFSFGCSAKLNREKRLVEIYFKAKDSIDGSGLLQQVAFFNNKQLQLALLQDGEYAYIDNDNPMSDISNGILRGFFIYDSFYVTTNHGERVDFLEAVPATKNELDFIESHHSQVHYKKMILAIKDYLGDRTDLKNIKGLSLDTLNETFNKLA